MGTVTVAVIGAGEMGAAVGRRLRECGARVLTSLHGRSVASAERVRRAGLDIVEDDDRLVRDADFALSIVPPGVAMEVAERLRTPLRRAKSQATFVECNAVAPATTHQIAALLSDTRFVDVGIIGGPPQAETEDPAKGPRFYASGPSASQLSRLSAFGLDITLLDGPVGAASGLKLAYAGLTKGLTALGAAMINVAARDGLEEALRGELARTQPQLLVRLEQYVPQMFPKAYRWVAEMEQIAEYISSPAEGAKIYEGIARLYEGIASPGTDDAVAHRRLERLRRFCKPPE